VYNPSTNGLNVRWEPASGRVQQYRVAYSSLGRASPTESVSTPPPRVTVSWSSCFKGPARTCFQLWDLNHVIAREPEALDPPPPRYLAPAQTRAALGEGALEVNQQMPCS